MQNKAPIEYCFTPRNYSPMSRPQATRLVTQPTNSRIPCIYVECNEASIHGIDVVKDWHKILTLHVIN
jgi:hypothetical protein